MDAAKEMIAGVDASLVQAAEFAGPAVVKELGGNCKIDISENSNILAGSEHRDNCIAENNVTDTSDTLCEERTTEKVLKKIEVEDNHENGTLKINNNTAACEHKEKSAKENTGITTPAEGNVEDSIERELKLMKSGDICDNDTARRKLSRSPQFLVPKAVSSTEDDDKERYTFPLTKRESFTFNRGMDSNNVGNISNSIENVQTLTDLSLIHI